MVEESEERGELEGKRRTSWGRAISMRGLGELMELGGGCWEIKAKCPSVIPAWDFESVQICAPFRKILQCQKPQQGFGRPRSSLTIQLWSSC